MNNRVFDPTLAAPTLVAAWRDATLLTGLPARTAPSNLAEAYMLQSRLREELAEPIAGYKVGLSSPAAMERSGLGEPIVGFVPRSRLLSSDSEVDVPAGGQMLLEVEIGFLTGSDTTGGDLSACLVFELVRSRFARREEVDLPSFVADSSGMHALVVGDAIAATDVMSLVEQGAVLLRDGAVAATALPERERPDPFDTLKRFERLAAVHGMPLGPHLLVATGSLIAPVVVDRSAVFEARLGPHRVRVAINRA